MTQSFTQITSINVIIFHGTKTKVSLSHNGSSTIRSIYIQPIETIVLSARILDKSMKLLLLRIWLIDSIKFHIMSYIRIYRIRLHYRENLKPINSHKFKSNSVIPDRFKKRWFHRIYLANSNVGSIISIYFNHYIGNYTSTWTRETM